MKKCAIYIRVSTPKKVPGKAAGSEVYLQNPAVQLEPLKQLASIINAEVFKVYSDRMSGANTNRPAYRELMTDARRRQFQVVIVWRFDRWARSTQELISTLEEFQALGIDFISQQEAIDTSTPMGKCLFTIIAAVAEMERHAIKERIRAGMEYARNHGTKSGKEVGRPKRVFRRDEAIALRQEGLPFREIARRLKVGDGTVRRACATMLSA